MIGTTHLSSHHSFVFPSFFSHYRKNDRLISEAAQNARKGGGAKDMSMEAEQTAWLISNGVPTTNSDAKYTWHVAPEAKVSF